jgi:hypothetical protein
MVKFKNYMVHYMHRSRHGNWVGALSRCEERVRAGTCPMPYHGMVIGYVPYPGARKGYVPYPGVAKESVCFLLLTHWNFLS